MIANKRAFGQKLIILVLGLVSAFSASAQEDATAEATVEATVEASVEATAELSIEAVQTNTPIEHFIVLMQENHSFDNYFGYYPGANGIPEGTCIPYDPFDPESDCVEPFRLGDGLVENDDPDHSEETHWVQFNEGLMNGFVYALDRRAQDGRLAMGYYDEEELPYYWNIADEYVLFDNFFSSVHGGSFDNHMYWAAGRTLYTSDVATVQDVLATVPTIFDRLEEKGISWKFYVQNYEPELNYRSSHLYPMNRASQVIWVPLLSFDRFIDDPSLSSHIVNLDEYYDDLVNGTLPSVAFMVPSGPSEHPPSSVLSGQRFVRTLLQRLMQSPYWSSSAFMWTYDDWGGWYDHVVPPTVDDYGYGFRVPALLVSSYARHGHIDSTQLDYTSMLKFIEENWGLEPLADRDRQANNFLDAFDFSSPPRQAVFVTFERGEGEHKVQPRRDVIYIAYGAALLFSLALVIWAQIQTQRGAATVTQEVHE
jgi:phospholipase C